MQSTDLEAFFETRMSESSHGLRSAAVARAIREAVQQGILTPGEALPAERNLCQTFSVSRTTLRRALELLEEDNVISRKVGAGNFISVRANMPKAVLTGFTEDIRNRGMTPISKVISNRRGAVSPDECFNLGLPPGSKVMRLERLRIADHNPMALALSVIPADAIPPDYDGTSSLYSAMGAMGNRPARIIQRYGAVVATAEQAELLGVSEGAALLLIQRLGFAKSGRAVEFTRSLSRGDQFFSPPETSP